MIPREFIDEVLNRTDIVNLVDNFVKLKKQGANYAACCPFHQEKTPSFTVSPTKQIFHCFGCGESGNAIGFLMAYSKQTFPEAVTTLAQQAGMTVPDRTDAQVAAQQTSQPLYQCSNAAAEYYQQQLRQHEQANQAITYLKNRGLTGEICKRFGIGFAPAGWDNLLKAMPNQTQHLLNAGLLIQKDGNRFYDRFRERIIFPIRDRRARTIGFGGRVLGDELPKYLNSPETVIFHKGKELYGLYEVLQHDRTPQQVIVVEGYMDVVSLAQFDINNAVATLGTAITKYHLQQLLRITKQIIFCFDGDRAGHEASERALQICLPLLQDGVIFKFLFLPDDLDPDDYIRKYGTAAFQEQIDKAASLADWLLIKLTEGHDLQRAEGKSAVIEQARGLLATLPESSIKELLIEQLSLTIRIPLDRLQQMLHGTKFQTATQKQLLPTLDTAGLSPNVRLAVALILQQPQIVLAVPEALWPVAEASDETDILRQIIAIVMDNPEVTCAQLLEYFRDNPMLAVLAPLAGFAHHVPETGMAAELIDIMRMLLSRSRNQQIQLLLAQGKRGQLTAAEKQQLQDLIKATKTATE